MRTAVLASLRESTGAAAAGRLAALFAMLLCVAAAYWPSLLGLHRFWTDTEARGGTHGYLVLAISVVLLLRSRADLAGVQLRPLPWAFLGIALTSLAWLVFWRAGLQDAHLLLIPVLVGLAVLAALGWPAVKVVVFPLALLYFAMPVWTSLTAPLQWLTVKAVTVLIWLTGLPAFVEGNFIHVPSGTFEVVGGCSGLHFFVVGLALAALYGEQGKDPWRMRLLWLALLGAVSLLSNWVRVFVIVVAGYLSDMQHYLVTVDHYTFGWAVFSAAMLLFFFLAGRYSADRAGPAGESAGAAHVAPSGKPRLIAVLGVLAALSVLPVLAYATDTYFARSPSALAIVWPRVTDSGATSLDIADESWQPYFQGATVSGRRRYWNAQGHAVDLYVVAYRRQEQGAELVGYGNSLLGKDDASRSPGESIVVAPGGAWREAAVVDSSERQYLLMWRYDIGGRAFVNPLAAQLWYGAAALVRPPLSSLVALRSPCEPDCEAARARIRQLASRVQENISSIVVSKEEIRP